MKDNQAKYPQLRFKGFTDPWEQRKVGELYKVTRGQVLATSKTTPEKVGKNQYPVYSSQTKNDGLMGYYSDYLFDTAITWTTDGANAGTVNFRPGKFYSTNVNGVLLSADGLANKAMAENLNRSAWKWVSHVGNPKLMNNVMSEISVMIPVNLSEQEKISEFLMMIDNTIALHQRKLAKLKELKQGYLQKMFPQNGSKFPQLRFAGFADAWEQRKLGELFKPSRNKNNNDLYNQKDILAASLGTELIPKRTFFGLKSTKESVKNYRVVKHGDLIYTKSPIKGFPNGIVRTNKGNVGIVPSLYCVYQAQKEINTSIIQLYFEDKNRLDFYLFPLVNVGARNNVNITDLEFLEGIIKVPKSIEEQKKIVDFIEHFNKAITLHQRKLEKLQELKKGYLQKMFC